MSRSNSDQGNDIMKVLLPIDISSHNGETEFTFKQLYKLGRRVSAGEKDFAMRSLDEIKAGFDGTDRAEFASELAGIKTFFNILIEDILFKNLQFPAVLVDFVVFDPEDKSGERFHMAICSNSEQMIRAYIDEVDKNFASPDNEPSHDRGPILSNSIMYSSPYFYRGPKERTGEDSLNFNRLTLGGPEDNSGQENFFIYFGSFKANHPNQLPKTKQTGIIELLFQSIKRELAGQDGPDQAAGNEKFELNTNILIPLFRPAASFSGDENFRTRGGGVFIYGFNRQEQNVDEMVLRLQHFFYRKILVESHTQMSADFFRHGGTNDLIHDFKTFLSSHVINGLEYIKINHELSARVDKLLTRVIDGSNEFITEYQLLLEAYRDFVRADQKSQLYNSRDFHNVIDSIRKLRYYQELDIRYLSENSDEQVCIRFNEAIMRKIFNNLIANTHAAYEKDGIAKTNRHILVKWSYNNRDETVTIEYINKNLSIDKSYLKDFGLRPLQTQSGSTGLGAYFINNTLGWMNALENKTDEEQHKNVKRYIKVANLLTGVCFSFKFKATKN